MFDKFNAIFCPCLLYCTIYHWQKELGTVENALLFLPIPNFCMPRAYAIVHIAVFTEHNPPNHRPIVTLTFITVCVLTGSDVSGGPAGDGCPALQQAVYGRDGSILAVYNCPLSSVHPTVLIRQRWPQNTIVSVTKTKCHVVCAWWQLCLLSRVSETKSGVLGLTIYKLGVGWGVRLPP